MLVGNTIPTDRKRIPTTVDLNVECTDGVVGIERRAEDVFTLRKGRGFDRPRRRTGAGGRAVWRSKVFPAPGENGYIFTREFFSFFLVAQQRRVRGGFSSARVRSGSGGRDVHREYDSNPERDRLRSGIRAIVFRNAEISSICRSPSLRTRENASALIVSCHMDVLYTSKRSVLFYDIWVITAQRVGTKNHKRSVRL